MSKLRPITAKHEEILALFLRGIDRVDFRILREAIQMLYRDQQRLDKMERLARLQRPERVDIEIRFTHGESLRQAVDRIRAEEELT